MGIFRHFLSKKTVSFTNVYDNLETTGRPLGRETWIAKLEKLTGRQIKSQKRGQKSKQLNNNLVSLVNCHHNSHRNFKNTDVSYDMLIKLLIFINIRI